MKFFYTFLLVSLFAFMGQAQKFLDPVSWDTEIVHTEGNYYEVILTANIDDKWAVYSQHVDEGGPIATEFTFDGSQAYKVEGKTIESSENRIVMMDNMFDMKLTKYKNKAIFTQTISSSGDLEKVTGTIRYMTCDDNRCLPPNTINFTAFKRQ